MSRTTSRPSRHSLAPVTRSAAPMPAEREARRHGFLCFSLGDEEYGVDLHLVRQIVKPPPLTLVPRTPPHILGVISVRGAVVTLIDARLLLGMQATEWPNGARVLLIDIDDEPVGLLVDAVTLVRRLPDSALERNPMLDESPQAERVIGVARPAPDVQITVIGIRSIVAEALR